MAQFKRAPSTRLGAFTTYGIKRWAGSLGLWGVAAGTGAMLILSATPLIRNDILIKVPVIGDYYTDKVPASDKPF